MNKFEPFLKIRVRVLEHIVEGGSVSDTLDLICRDTEETDPEMRCSVLYVDQNAKCLRHAAAPSLPDFYNDAIDGIEIGMGAGSCGTAAFTGERVIAEDVFSDPYWVGYRDLAKKVGFQACWSQPIYSKGKEVLGTFAMYYDEVRQPTDDELLLIQAQASLVSLVIERKHAEEELRKSEIRHQNFSADVAHELRTPLSVLKLHLDDMEDSILVKTLQRDVYSMSHLVEQLLAMAQMDTLTISKDDEADLHAVCTNVAANLAPIIIKGGRSIEVVGARGPVWVPGISGALEQAVRNLVENAIKYSPTGTTVTIDVGEDGHIRVIDQGKGIPKDKREEIFERFLRADRREAGAGLGLSIVRRSVEAHGGTVRVDDAPGGGAMFTISFANAAR